LDNHAKAACSQTERSCHYIGKTRFSVVRQRGSHRQYRHSDGRGTTVPFHAGRDISPILLRQIVKDIGLTLEEFLEHR